MAATRIHSLISRPVMADRKMGTYLLAAGIVLPWLLPYSPLPWPSFYREWLCMVFFGGAALLDRQNSYASVRLADSSFIPVIVFLGGVLCLQALLMEGLWAKTLIIGFYLVFAFSAYSLGVRLQSSGDGNLRLILGAVLVAALLSCLFGAIQMGFGEAADPFVFPRQFRSVYGNIAQANHFADLLWLAVLAIPFLVFKGVLRVPLAIGALLVLVGFSVFSASRSVWLYAVVSVVAGVLCSSVVKPERLPREIAGLFFFGAILLPVLYLLFRSTGVLAYYGIGGSIERMAGDSSGNALRLWLWKAGLLAAIEHPLLGVGAGRFVGFSSGLAAITPGAPIAGSDTSAHNIFFHVAAEFGIPAALVLTSSVFLSFFRPIRRGFSLHSLSILAVLAVMMVHACLEYPLWYAYFLGPYALFLGMIEAKRVTVNSRFALLSRCVGGFVLVGCMFGYQQFRHLETAMQDLSFQAGLGGVISTSPRVGASLSGVPQWSPFVDARTAIELMAATPQDGDAMELSKECDSAVRFAPSPYLLARCSSIYYLADRLQDAKAFGERLCKIYPASAGELAKSYVLALRASKWASMPEFSCISRH